MSNIRSTSLHNSKQTSAAHADISASCLGILGIICLLISVGPLFLLLNGRDRYPGTSLPRRKAATLDEAVEFQRQLINDCSGQSDRPALAHWNAALHHIAIRCGLREGELIGLRRKDIDLDRHELRVMGQLQKGKRKAANLTRS